MKIVAVCELYHWTYQEFMNQPTWFIDLIMFKYGVDAKNAKTQQEKISHG